MNPRALAVQGIGFSPKLIALQGIGLGGAGGLYVLQRRRFRRG